MDIQPMVASCWSRRAQLRFMKAVGLAVGLGLGVAWSSSTLAQSAVHAPGVAPTHAADFSGIWAIENGLADRTLERTRGAAPPPYKPDWMAAFLAVRTKADIGERVRDPAKECWPTGMPGFNNWAYPGEIIMSPGQVTLLTEYENQTRRVFTDGRRHPPADELEATMRGHSIGHWEGATLVVDTVGIRTESEMGLRGKHSNQLHITERLRLLGPDKLEWTTTHEDPIALTKPWTQTRILVRQPPETEIREYICEENTTREEYLPSSGTVVWPNGERSGPGDALTSR